jgi:ribokinase
LSNAAVQIVVVGSYNRDLALRVDQFPAPGETRLSLGRAESPGGKGSNQAIQAAQCGAPTAMIAAIGQDLAGDEALSLWSGLRIDTSAVVRLAEAATGMAMILVDRQAENMIVVDSGANDHLSQRHILAARPLIMGAKLVLAQLETPIAATLAAFDLARSSGVTTLLNAAPANAALDHQLLALTDILCVNQTEGAALSGQTSPEAIGTGLLEMGPAMVILTLGVDGAMLFQRGQPPLRAHPPTVSAIDTTGAGDAFIGSFAAQWLLNQDPSAALDFALAAGALACTRNGAAASFGNREEIERLAASCLERP